MNRREFCMAAGAAAALSASDLLASSARAATLPAEADPNPAGGYTLKPPRQFLFTDYRHISPGDLSKYGRPFPLSEYFTDILEAYERVASK